MKAFGASGEGGWIAKTTGIPRVDPLLADGGGEPLFFWAERGLSAAGFGVAAEAAFEELEGVPCVADHPALPGPWFGGLAFDRQRHRPVGAWAGFPSSRLLLPRVLVWTTAEGSFVTTWARRGVRAVADVRERPLTDSAARLVRAECDRGHWTRLLGTYLEAIGRGEASKVVAAREVRVELDREVEVRALLARLRAAASVATVFMIRSADGEAAFLGATPERLCRLRSRRLETEALASSAAPGAQLALTGSDKDRREHQAVIDGLEAALGPLCESVRAEGAPQLLELPYVTHLRTPLSATLRARVRPSEVLAAIYPTAAVGGAPRPQALELIATHEGWDRGWYAGAIGWASVDALDLKVGIRSALVRGRQARVFVGAGIVAGSEADREWEETELKAQPMLSALGGAADARR